MSERAPRRQRKLPTLPQTRKTQDFWPTFRGAVDWIQKHQDTIETALNLLEIYPKLIKHKACDRLWDFISKVAFFDKVELAAHHTHLKNEAKDKMVRETNGIPAISITETNDKVCTSKVTLVYVCGNIMDDKWQSLVLGLSEKFFIRCSKEKKLVPQEDNMNWITNIDSFIFLMDSRAIFDSYYLNQLQTALAWKIPVTFVRDPGFVLPDPLPNSVRKVPNSQNINNTFCNGVCQRRANSVKQQRKLHAEEQEIRSFSANQLHTEAISDFRHFKTPIPVSPLGSLNLPAIPLTPMPNRSSQSGSNETSITDVLFKHFDLPSSAEDPSVTISDTLTKGSENAILYHRLYRHECLDRIAAALKDETDKSDSTWSINSISTVSDTALCKTEDSDTDEMEAQFVLKTDMSKETKQYLNNEKRVSLESESLSDSGLSSPVETIYAIYSDNKDTPELVHWPVREHSEVTASPSLESFGFQDVDLSRSVNQLDLTSSDDSY